MIKLGLVFTNQYRLLSRAAILDVFETVNGLYRKEQEESPFSIVMISPDNIDTGSFFSTYPVVPATLVEDLYLIMIPAFSTQNILLAVQPQTIL